MSYSPTIKDTLEFLAKPKPHDHPGIGDAVYELQAFFDSVVSLPQVLDSMMQGEVPPTEYQLAAMNGS
jgi:hypothetical protein